MLNEGMRYRDLDTGTFLTRDPLGYKDGPNIYCYVHCNPITHFDAYGLADVASFSDFLSDSAPAWGAVIANVIKYSPLAIFLCIPGDTYQGAHDQVSTGTQSESVDNQNDATPASGTSTGEGATDQAAALNQQNGTTSEASLVDSASGTTSEAQNVAAQESGTTFVPTVDSLTTDGIVFGSVHGNSNASTKEQHGYVIRDTHNNGVVVKNGISGQSLNKNGSSPRANAQANKWNKETTGNEGRYEAEVVFGVAAGEGARAAAKEAEKKVSDQNRETLDPERHTRP